MDQSSAVTPIAPTHFEVNHHQHGTFICWKSVISGVLASLLAYMVFSALGAGIGGYTASRIIHRGGDDTALTTAAGVWLGGAAVLSQFLGSYFATRFSTVTHKQVASARAIVISAVFFYLLINSGSSTFGSFSEVAANLASSKAVSEEDVGASGWLLFITLVVGIVASVLGAIEGTIGNVKRPFSLR